MWDANFCLHEKIEIPVTSNVLYVIDNIRQVKIEIYIYIYIDVPVGSWMCFNQLFKSRQDEAAGISHNDQ